MESVSWVIVPTVKQIFNEPGDYNEGWELSQDVAEDDGSFSVHMVSSTRTLSLFPPQDPREGTVGTTNLAQLRPPRSRLTRSPLEGNHTQTLSSL
jgi:hypothetical protein